MKEVKGVLKAGIDQSAFRKNIGRTYKIKPGIGTVNYIMDNLYLKFYELVWDGKYKHFIELPLEARIWSSSTLYSEGMQRERQEWFENFEVLSDLHVDSVLKFHSTADINNMDYGIVMDRGFVKTMSITQVEKCGNDVSMRYENLESKTVTAKTFNLTEVVNG